MPMLTGSVCGHWTQSGAISAPLFVVASSAGHERAPAWGMARSFNDPFPGCNPGGCIVAVYVGCCVVPPLGHG